MSAESDYTGRLRVRTSGILIQDDAVLLIDHKGVNGTKHFWAPPGGEVNFRESLEEATIREFEEETTLKVKVKSMLRGHEFINNNLHAIEFFFEVSKQNGHPKIGSDPEYSKEDQIIVDLKWMDIEQLITIGEDAKHSILHNLNHVNDLLKQKSSFDFIENSNR